MQSEWCLVDVRGVTKAFGSKQALVGVDLSVAPGEVVGLVGPNGAGKSTLMKVLCGVASCSVGEGHVLDCPLREATRRVPFVGVMIERPTFIELLSGRANLGLLAGIRGEIDDARIDEVLEQVGLSGARDVRVRQYSLGMRQRLSLAQAIMEHPRLLVLDEPTNGLDPDGIIEMRELLREQARAEGTGVLVSSHLLGEVEAVCDRVVLIESGRVRGEFRPGAGDQEEIRLELADPRQLPLVRETTGVLAVLEGRGPRLFGVRTSLGVPELVEALVLNGVRIEGVHRAGTTLEDVYRQKLGRTS